MKKLITKSMLTTSLFLMVILIFAYHFIYHPLYNALEETSLENFINMTETSRKSFAHIIERGIENSKSISSRTMIKKKIIEYKDGIVDLEELKTYTQPRYIEGIQVLEKLVYSARVVDDQIIASRGEPPITIKSIDGIKKLDYEVVEENKGIYLLVYSPIKSNIIIGMDIVVFNLSGFLSQLELYHMSIDIVTKDETINYQDSFTINPLISKHTGPDNIIYLNVFYELGDDLFLHISTPKDVFYYDFDAITKRSFTNLMIMFILSFLCINGIIIVFVTNKINSLDKSREKYKQDSYYDPLTGAYSRLFLNQWLKDNKGKTIEYAIVFIDMNNFKEINDQYGHNTGDGVLKEVVSALQDEIRDNDLIVRFGGDEFLILLDCVSHNITAKVIEKINNNLKPPTLSDIEVSFSYGIGELENTTEFYDVLEQIDRKMYEMKKTSNLDFSKLEVF